MTTGNSCNKTDYRHELIGRRTRTEFREFLVGFTLAEIEREFEAEHIFPDHDYDPKTSGQRRSYVEQHYHTLNFSQWEDVARLLLVYENILIQIPKEYEAQRNKLLQWLRRDGIQFENGRLVPLGLAPNIAHLKTIGNFFSSEYLAQQLKRMEASIDSDPPLAIGTAKELVETCCKTILSERGITPPKTIDLPKLVKQTVNPDISPIRRRNPL